MMFRSLRFVGGSLFVVLMVWGGPQSPVVFAQGCPELVGRWPHGPARTAAVEGDLAYFSSGPTLMISDFSDPTAPALMGELALEDVIADIEVSEGYVFVTEAGGTRLVIVDATTPEAPEVVGALLNPDTPLNDDWNDVEVAGNRAFLKKNNTIFIVDVSDKSHPVEVGSYVWQRSSNITAYTVSETMMYLTTSSYLEVVDVTNPSQPAEIGSIELPNMSSSGNIAYYNDVIFVPQSWAGLRFIDVSDPANPTDGGEFSPGWSIDFIEVSEDVAYAVSSFHGDLHTVDVSDLQNPTEMGNLSFLGRINDLAISAERAYVTTDAGLFVADVSDPAQPTEVGVYGTAGPARDLHMTGDHAFVAAELAGMRVIDISETLSPQEIGSLASTEFGVSAISGAGNYVFLCDGGLRVVDVLDPSQPTEVAYLQGHTYHALMAAGDFVYGAHSYGLDVIDVSDPASPTVVGVLDYDGTRWEPENLDIEGEYLFLANGGRGLLIIDVSDPEHPSESGLFEPSGYLSDVLDVVVSSGTAFIALSDGLSAIDVSNPSAPVLLGALQSWDAFSGVDIWDGLLFAVSESSRSSRLIAVDISIPANPTEVGSYELLSEASTLAVVDGIATVANLAAGLSFFDVSTCGMNPPTAAFSVRPDFPKASEPVSFTDLSSGSPSSWTWHFGDGSEGSTEKNPAHTYASAGVFTVTLTVENSMGSDSASQQIVVELGGQRIYIPVAGVGAGVGDSFWTSDVVLNNRDDEQITFDVQFLAKGEDNTDPQDGGRFTLDPGVSALYQNVLGEMFGITSGSGALCFASADLGGAILMSRTKSTDAEGATFGQGIPAVAEADLILPGVGARLIGLAENENSRTNIGFLNGSGQNLDLTVSFFAEDDTLLGQDQITLAPYSFDQWNRAFNRIDAGSVENGWVEVASHQSARGRFYSYASVVDNLKGDPTYILPQLAQGPGVARVFIPASGVGGGVGASMWSTDIVLHRRGVSNMTYTVTFFPKGADNSNAQPVGPFDFHPANNGRSLFHQDILAELFDLTAASGALVFDLTYANDLPFDYVLLMSRTKNTDADGATFGQGIPSVAEDKLIPADTKVRLIQLAENTSLRTNIGFMNGSGFAINLNVEFFSGDGISLGTDSVFLQPYSYNQWNRAFSRVGKTVVDNGYVDIWTTTPGGLFYAYGSVVDELKGDPTYIQPQ